MITTLTMITALATVQLAASPGEAPPSRADAPAIAREAVKRRLPGEKQLRFGPIIVKLSRTMPGYVVCGQVRPGIGPAERFFVVIPGSFAVLDRDGDTLVTKYWSLNGC